MSDLYIKIHHDEQREKRHLPIPVIVAIALAALALIALLILRPTMSYRRYVAFLESLSADTTYAYANDSLRCERADQPPLRLTGENAYAVYNKLVAAGQGSFGGEAPEGGGVLLDYGNGATLELWPKTFSGSGRRDGLMVRYTDAEGKTTVVSTNRTAYSYFSVLFSPSHNPLWDE